MRIVVMMSARVQAAESKVVQPETYTLIVIPATTLESTSPPWLSVVTAV